MKTASTANSAQTQQRMHRALVIALGAYLVGPAAGAVQIRAAIDRGIRAPRSARSVTGCQVGAVVFRGFLAAYRHPAEDGADLALPPAAGHCESSDAGWPSGRIRR
jgi:hypothetical protein